MVKYAKKPDAVLLVGGVWERLPEPVFVNLLRGPGIDSQPGGPVRQPYLSYRPARLHRLVETTPGLLKRLQIRALVISSTLTSVFLWPLGCQRILCNIYFLWYLFCLRFLRALFHTYEMSVMITLASGMVKSVYDWHVHNHPIPKKYYFLRITHVAKKYRKRTCWSMYCLGIPIINPSFLQTLLKRIVTE